MQIHRIRNAGVALLLMVLCLFLAQRWARLSKPIEACGAVPQPLVFLAGQDKNPFLLDWHKDTEVIKNGHPAALSNGVVVVIHYKNVSFQNSLLKKVTLADGLRSQSWRGHDVTAVTQTDMAMPATTAIPFIPPSQTGPAEEDALARDGRLSWGMVCPQKPGIPLARHVLFRRNPLLQSVVLAGGSFGARRDVSPMGISCPPSLASRWRAIFLHSANTAQT